MRGKESFYDTNVLAAYLFREEGRYKRAYEVMAKHRRRAISIISIHEIHVLSIRLGVSDRFLRIKDDLDRLFDVIGLSQGTCIRASNLRVNFKMPEVDSLILSTAVENGYRNFYTFDADFEELNGEKVGETTIHYLTSSEAGF